MLAEGLVEGEIVDSTGPETVRGILKKCAQPWLKECWCLTPQGISEFACAMKDALEVYHRPFDDNEVPVS